VRRLRPTPLLAAAACAIACAAAEEQSAPPRASNEDGRLSVYVVSEPLRSFAQQIGGDRVEVVFPAPPDVDPAHWSPDAETLAAYQGADLLLANGAGYASWRERATLRRRGLVNTSSGFADRLIEISGSPTHQHGPAGEHSHAETAFTTWLDPRLAAEQARAVSAALERERPEYAEEFQARLGSLEAELAALDARLEQATAGIGAAPILFSHPVYAYFERRYALNGRSLHWEPDAHPDAAAWAELDALLEAHPARLILWEAEPLAQTRGELAARGVRSVVFAPGGNRAPDGESWLERMNANAARLEAVP